MKPSLLFSIRVLLLPGVLCALALQANAQALYGVTASTNRRFDLVRINEQTGALATIATIDLAAVQGVPTQVSDPYCLTWDPTRCAFLLLASNVPPSPFLLTINPDTGAAQAVGPISGLPSDQQLVEGLAYSYRENQYLISYGASNGSASTRVAIINAQGAVQALSNSNILRDIDTIAASAQGVYLFDCNDNTGIVNALSGLPPSASTFNVATWPSSINSTDFLSAVHPRSDVFYGSSTRAPFQLLTIQGNSLVRLNALTPQPTRAIASHAFAWQVPITQQPTSTSTCPQGAATFSVTVAGAGEVRCQWQWQPEGTAPAWINIVDGANTLSGSFLFTANGATRATLTMSRAPNRWVFPSPGSSIGRARCLVSTACGSEFTNEAVLSICVADTDDGSGAGRCDGGISIDDLLYFLQFYAAGHLFADVDDGTFTGTPDGGVTIDDLLYYLLRFEAGC